MSNKGTVVGTEFATNEPPVALMVFHRFLPEEDDVSDDVYGVGFNALAEHRYAVVATVWQIRTVHSGLSGILDYDLLIKCMILLFRIFEILSKTMISSHGLFNVP